MQLREGTCVLMRQNGQVQVGLGRKSVILENLAPAEQSYLQSLKFPNSAGSLATKARKRGVSPARVSELEHLLAEHNLSTSTYTGSGVQPIEARRRAKTRIDIVAFECGDPKQFFHMQPFASALIQAVKGAGMSQIRFDYRGRDMGNTAPSKLNKMVGLSQTYKSEPDLVVALFARTSSSALVHEWQQAGIPHLPVVFHEDCVQIGPMVRDGVGPCLKCVDRNFRDLDPHWPALQIQCREQPFPALSDPLFEVSAIMAARLVSNEVDQRGMPAGEVRFVDENFVMERFTWPTHHNCGCSIPLSVEPLSMVSPSMKSPSLES